MCSRIELFRSWKLEVGTPNKQFMVCIISSDFRMFLNEDYVLTVHGVDLTESVETFSHQAFVLGLFPASYRCPVITNILNGF